MTSRLDQFDNIEQALRLRDKFERIGNELPNFISAARNLAPHFLALAKAAQRATKARDAIQGFGDTREWLEPLLSLAKEHDAAMDELRAALAPLLEEVPDGS